MLDFLRRRSAPPTDLMQIIGEVRTRWRMKLALRGTVTALAVVVALVLVAAYGMEWARFSPASIITARILLVLGVVASVGYFLVRPLRRHAWRRDRRRDSRPSSRSRVRAQRRQSHAARVAERRGGRAVPNRSDAGQRRRAQGRGPDHQREAIG